MKTNFLKSKVGYLDESGDNGKNGTKYLILTYLYTRENKKISKIIKKYKKEILKTSVGKNWIKKNKGEIKFAKFPDKQLRKNLIEGLSKLDLEISCMIINKNKSKVFYEERKHIIFSVLEKYIKKKHCFPFKMILDKDFLKIRKTNYVFLRRYENMKAEIIDNSSEIIFSEYRDIDENDYIKLNEENSKFNYGLQAVDLISGAIFREYEFGDKEYTNLIKQNKNINIRFKKILK